jgi:hypothetical protein
MTWADFPILLLEIISDGGSHRDECRMKLQAACLVRLGNTLFTKSGDFFVKGIYIDGSYHATEYTFYQVNGGPVGVVDSLDDSMQTVIVPFIFE